MILFLSKSQLGRGRREKPDDIARDPLPISRKEAERMEKNPEELEVERLTEIYKGLPPKQFALAQGLIVQAARLRVRLDKLWAELEEKGETEWFTQSEKTDPYERERPASRTFTATDKSYQSIIKQLNDMIPADKDDDSGFDCE